MTELNFEKVSPLAASRLAAESGSWLHAVQGCRLNFQVSREIEAQVSRQREHLERWNEQLSKETASAVATRRISNRAVR